MSASSDIDPYFEWDAAYVLGSLSPTERREYERHLHTCEECSEAVAELAALPGLLAKVPSEDALLDRPVEVPVPATLLPRLVRSARRRSIRTRAWVAGGIVAAAAAAAAAVLIISATVVPTPGVTPNPLHTNQQITVVSMNPVTTTPLSASLTLTAEGASTRIDMACHYGNPPTDSPSPLWTSYGDETLPAWGYGMYVTDTQGRVMQVATWISTAGSTAEPSAIIHTPISQITSIDVRSTTNGRVLLTGAP